MRVHDIMIVSVTLFSLLPLHFVELVSLIDILDITNVVISFELQEFNYIACNMSGEQYELEKLFDHADYQNYIISSKGNTEPRPNEQMLKEYFKVNVDNYVEKCRFVAGMLYCKYAEIIKKINNLLFYLTKEYLDYKYKFRDNEISEYILETLKNGSNKFTDLLHEMLSNDYLTKIFGTTCIDIWHFLRNIKLKHTISESTDITQHLRQIKLSTGMINNYMYFRCDYRKSIPSERSYKLNHKYQNDQATEHENNQSYWEYLKEKIDFNIIEINKYIYHFQVDRSEVQTQ